MNVTPGPLSAAEARRLSETVRRLDAMQRLRVAAPLTLFGGNVQPVVGIDPCALRALLSRSDCDRDSGSGAGQAVVEFPVVTNVECASGGGVVQTTTTYRLRIDFVAQTAEVEAL